MSSRCKILLRSLLRCFVCSMAAAISLLPNSATAQTEHYNLVLIELNDLGKEWIGCYSGGEEDEVETPHIDALAESGIKFNNFYSMPESTPTRVSLLTGQYPFRHGWVGNWNVPAWGGGCSFDPERNSCFPVTIRDAGYQTAVAGDWRLDDFRVEPQAMNDAGFENYCMWTGNETGNQPSSQHYQNPFVYEAGRSRTRSGEFGPDIYTNYLVDFLAKNKEQPMFVYYPMVLSRAPLTATPDEPDVKGSEDLHKTSVQYADKLVGRMIAAIEENGLRQNTVIVLTSNNGTRSTVADREKEGGISITTESRVNVPFIVSCPGRIAAGAESNALIDVTDIAPTFCEIAKVEQYGEQFDGKSFVAVLDGESEKSQREWIMAMGGGNSSKLTDQGLENGYWFRDRVLRNQRYKAYIGTDRKMIKLVDLQNDPQEAIDSQGAESVEIQNAQTFFEKAIAEMPKRDADPHYTPLGHRQWYRKPTMKSQVWKSGYPGK